MVRRYRYAAVGALVALIVAAGALHAQTPEVRRFGNPGVGGPGIGVPLAALNLSDAQREQVRQLTRQHQEQTRTLVERMRTAQAARQQAVETLPVDEGRIRAVMQDLAAVEADLAVERARLRSEIFAILTPGQQAQAQELRAQRQTRMQERRGRR